MVKENNYFDKVKKEKYAEMTPVEKEKQFEFFRKWCKDMFFRKDKGDEKYGNYMMEVDDETSFEELREEMIDCCNHLIMLTYRVKERINYKKLKEVKK